MCLLIPNVRKLIASEIRLWFQMNGFELAGRAMKVGHVTDRTDGQLGGIGGQGGKQM